MATPGKSKSEGRKRKVCCVRMQREGQCGWARRRQGGGRRRSGHGRPSWSIPEAQGAPPLFGEGMKEEGGEEGRRRRGLLKMACFPTPASSLTAPSTVSTLGCHRWKGPNLWMCAWPRSLDLTSGSQDPPAGPRPLLLFLSAMGGGRLLVLTAPHVTRVLVKWGEGLAWTPTPAQQAHSTSRDFEQGT